MSTNLADLGISRSELQSVVDSALARVTPAYAQAKLHDVEVTRLPRLEETDQVVVILRILTSSPRAARGQYLPLTALHDAGFVDEYVFGVIHGHWLATYNRDLFFEVRFLIDTITADADGPPLYELISVQDAQDSGLIPEGSPLAAHLSHYGLQFVLRAGSVLSGPSTGMIDLVAEQTRHLSRPRFLDLFSGSGALARVALVEGAQSAVCVDSQLDRRLCARNLGDLIDRAELRAAPANRACRPDEHFDLVAVDPFYDHTLGALRECWAPLAGRYRHLVVNLGTALPTRWNERIIDELTMNTSAFQLQERYGERLALCTP